ncbi:MAG: flippase [Kiritimatiellia bacterium]
MTSASEVSKIAKNTLFLNIATITTRGLSFATSLLLARYLGEMAFGRYAFALSFAGIFVILTDLGLGYLTVREVARDRSAAGKYLGHTLIIRAALGLVTFALIVTATAIMQYPLEVKAVVYILAFFTIFKCLIGSFNAIFMAFEKMGIVALLDVIMSALILGGILAGIYLKQDLLGIIRVYPAAVIVCFCLAFWIAARTCAAPQYAFDISFARDFVRYSIPFALASICMVIFTNIDTVMLKTMQGDVTAGYYGVTRALVSALVFIPANFMTVLYPVFSRCYQSPGDSLARYYGQSFRLLAIMAMPIAAGGVIVAEKVIVTFYGTSYAPAAPALQVMTLALAVQFITAPVTMVMLASNRQKSVTWVSFTAMLLNVMLNLILIPRYGLVGASVATLASYALILAFLYHLASKNICRLNAWRLAYKAILAALLMGCFTFLFRNANVFLVIGLSAAIYTALLVALGELRRIDIDLIRNQLFKSDNPPE